MLGLGLGLPQHLMRQRPIWTPAALFAQCQQGAWYEPKPEYLYQDAAGTVPVTADGDPVGYMRDLSGNGNHATQSTSAARPIYRTDGVLHWLEFDGVDDFLVTPLTSYRAQLTAFYVARLDAGVNVEGAVISSAKSTSPDSGLRHSLRLDGNPGWRFTFYAGKAPGSGFVASSAIGSATEMVVRGITWDGSLSEDAVKTFSNKTLVREQTSTRDLSLDIETTGPMTIGRMSVRTDGHLRGEFHGALIRESAIYGDEESLIEYLASRTGVTL